MDKLKLYSPKINVVNVVEEQLLYFGNIETKIINKNNTFIDLNQEIINNLIEYTDVKDCDFIYYPYKINPNENINYLIELSEKFNKKILLFYNDDNDFIFNYKNSIIFRTSLYKTIKPQNYYSLPAFCNDLKKTKDFFFREKSDFPIIGFCGAITHNYRNLIINQIKISNKLKKNLIIRNAFWGGDIWGEKIRNEYINNILNSDFVICVRGAGNFSYRLYETICLGKIPLIIDSDLDLPFDDFLNYKELFLIIKIDEISIIEEKIINYWNNIKDYNILQEKLIFLWEEHLSPIGFIKTLNKYKNEINNLLH